MLKSMFFTSSIKVYILVLFYFISSKNLRQKNKIKSLYYTSSFQECCPENDSMKKGYCVHCKLIYIRYDYSYRDNYSLHYVPAIITRKNHPFTFLVLFCKINIRERFWAIILNVKLCRIFPVRIRLC